MNASSKRKTVQGITLCADPAREECFRVAQGDSEIWNIQISDKVTAPVMRQTVKRGHGVM